MISARRLLGMNNGANLKVVNENWKSLMAKMSIKAQLLILNGAATKIAMKKDTKPLCPAPTNK